MGIKGDERMTAKEVVLAEDFVKRQIISSNSLNNTASACYVGIPADWSEVLILMNICPILGNPGEKTPYKWLCLSFPSQPSDISKMFFKTDWAAVVFVENRSQSLRI